MKTEKRISSVILSAALLFGFGGIREIQAAPLPAVVYDGEERAFSLEHVQGSDLFPEFKEMMPGDHITQDIIVSVENTDGPVSIYLQAKKDENTGDSGSEGENLFQNVYLTVKADGKVISSGSLGDTEGPEKGVKIFAFENPGEKKLEVTLDVSEEAGNELMDAQTTVDWTFTVQDYSDRNNVSIQAMDLTAYTGGESLDSDSFPTPRYTVETPEGVDISDLIFYIDGASPFQIEDGETGIIQELEETFTYVGNGVDAAPSTDDQQAGIYSIGIEEAEKITAQADGKTYSVEYIPGTLTVRYVTDPAGVSAGTTDITVPVVESIHEMNPQESGTAVGVTGGDAVFKTNGKTELAGLTEGDRQGKISLLCDNVLSLDTDISDRESQLQGRADEFLKQSGYSLKDRQYEYRYLDMVNENDGNVWVSSSTGVDVYYPYPEGTSYEKADDTLFTVLHFKNLHREYGFESGETIEELIRNCEVEEIPSESTPYGIKFHVPESGFSPFAVTWQPADSTAVKTGDNDDYVSWVVILAGGAVVAVLTVRRVKNSKKSKN